jgi:hypothetical protein
MQGAPGERVKFINNVPHLAFRQSLRSQCGEGGWPPAKNSEIFGIFKLSCCQKGIYGTPGGSYFSLLIHWSKKGETGSSLFSIEFH